MGLHAPVRPTLWPVSDRISKLLLQRCPAGGWKVIYKIDRRWSKNSRNPENIVSVLGVGYSWWCSHQSRWNLLPDDFQLLHALALTEKACYDIAFPQDLGDFQIPVGEDYILVRWTEAIKSLPILRMLLSLAASPKSHFLTWDSIQHSKPI